MFEITELILLDIMYIPYTVGEDFEAYMQVIMQMVECDCLIGYLVYFNPLFKHGGFRVIEFNTTETHPESKGIIADMKLYKTRKIEIIKTYEREKEILMNITN